MSIYDKSSLVLIPSGTKTGKIFSQKPVSGDGDFTFTRASAATRVNADGLIEKGRENVLKKSNQPNTHTINLSTYSGNQADPFGGNTAWAWRETATTGQHYGITNNDQVLGVGVWTFSVYVKPVNKTSVYFTWNSPNASNYGNVDFNFNSKTFTKSNVIAAGYEELTNGWFRLYYAINVSVAGSHNVYYNTLSTYTGDVNNGFDFTRFQIERGLVATDYIETDENPVEAGITDNTPRLDYTDSSCPALLLEPQRTNDVEHSEYFEGSGWGLLQASLTANNSNSPEGLQNAYSFVPNTTNTTHLVYETITKSAGTYSASCFFKADGYDYGNIRLATDSDAKRYSVTIDLTDGTFASQDTYGSPTSTGYNIENIGNGWYRLSVTSAHSSGFIYHTISLSNVASPTYNNGLPQFAGDGTKGVLIYGAQLEAGSYATSYIPTYGSSVSRVAETCSKTGISSLIGQTEGTMYFELTTIANSQYKRLSLNNGGYTNSILFDFQDNNFLIAKAFNGGSPILSISSSVAIADIRKIAIAYKNNDYAFYVNGSLMGTLTSIVVPSGLSAFDFNLAGNQNFEGDIKQALLFKTRLSNEELADLTTI